MTRSYHLLHRFLLELQRRYGPCEDHHSTDLFMLPVGHPEKEEHPEKAEGKKGADEKAEDDRDRSMALRQWRKQAVLDWVLEQLPNLTALPVPHAHAHAHAHTTHTTHTHNTHTILTHTYTHIYTHIHTHICA